MRTRSDTHSPQWRQSWAGTSSIYVQQWATRITGCCSATCDWRQSET
jgi:hypothetical protein